MLWIYCKTLEFSSTPKIIQTTLSWNLSLLIFAGENNHGEGMTILNAFSSVFSVQRNGQSYGWLVAVHWWKIFILWELYDWFSNPIIPTNINTNTVPLVIFHHHVLKKVAHSILLNTVYHLSQQLKLYPEHILTGWSQALWPIWKVLSF